MQPGRQQNLDFPSAPVQYKACMWIEVCHHLYHHILRTYGGELCPWPEVKAYMGVTLYDRM